MIGAIGAISGALGSWTASATALPATGVTDPTALLNGSAVTTATGGGSFGELMSRSLEQLQQTQTKSDSLAVKAATGDLRDVHDYMIASTQATLATDLAMAVRNKGLESFNEIMRMPV